MIKSIVTDIEGTTSSLHFIRNTLLPYVPQVLPSFIKTYRHRDDVEHALKKIDVNKPLSHLDDHQLIDALLLLMHEKQKTKQYDWYDIQLLVLEYGYLNRELCSHVYDDAYQFFVSCAKQNIVISVFSHAPVVGQKLFFRHTLFGDITHLFSHYFDPSIGAKNNMSSYQSIATSVRTPCSQMLYLSDSTEELDAAKMAGYQTVLVQHDNTEHAMQNHPIVTSFSQVNDLLA